MMWRTAMIQCDDQGVATVGEIREIHPSDRENVVVVMALHKFDKRWRVLGGSADLFPSHMIQNFRWSKNVLELAYFVNLIIFASFRVWE